LEREALERRKLTDHLVIGARSLTAALVAADIQIGRAAYRPAQAHRTTGIAISGDEDRRRLA
jgi:hypothetical protein